MQHASQGQGIPLPALSTGQSQSHFFHNLNYTEGKAEALGDAMPSVSTGGHSSFLSTHQPPDTSVTGTANRTGSRENMEENNDSIEKRFTDSRVPGWAAVPAPDAHLQRHPGASKGEGRGAATNSTQSKLPSQERRNYLNFSINLTHSHY